MPKAARRPCTYPGCNELVSGGRCVRHSPNVVVRDPRVRALYNSQRWRVIRQQQLAQHPWCEDCQAEGNLVTATEVDHVDPHRGDQVKFFAGPFRSLCKSHHSRKTAVEVGLIPPQRKF